MVVEAITGRSREHDVRVERARRAVVAAVVARLDEVAERMVAAYRQEIPAYGLDDPAVLDQVWRTSRMNVHVLLDSVAEGLPPGEETLPALRELGRERAAQGFPLHAIVQAYQVGGRITWDVLAEEVERQVGEPDVSAPVLAALSNAVLAFTTFVSAEVASAYTDAQRDTAAGAQRDRWHLFEELLSGTGRSAAVIQRARDMGLALGDRHGTVIVAMDQLGSLDRAVVEGVRHRLCAALEGIRLGAGGAIVQPRGSTVVAICPLGPDATVRDLREAVRLAIARANVEAAPNWVAAVGSMRPGVLGIAESYRQAQRVLEAARRENRNRTVLGYLSMIPTLMLWAEQDLTDDLRALVIEPLRAADRERDHRLVETLEVVLDEGGNLHASAKRLFVHRHTLSARLKRIEEILGRDLRSRTDLRLLDLALEAERLHTASASPP